MFRNAIDHLFQRLLLNSRMSGRFVADPDLDHAFVRARRLLSSEMEERDTALFELRLRLAMHLCPAEAIAYDRRRPISRKELVKQYIMAQHGRSEDESEELARDVVRVLRAWEEERQAVNEYLEELWMRQERKCAHCNVRLYLSAQEAEANPPTTQLKYDEYKPYHLAPLELRAPEVDHIEPVARLGDNRLENLQVLCRLCNAGKGDRLGIDVRSEANHAGYPIERVPRHLRLQMFYYVVARSNRECINCGSTKSELTIRKVNDAGGYLRSNLYVVCVRCAFS
jgi:hypothetical protein